MSHLGLRACGHLFSALWPFMSPYMMLPATERNFSDQDREQSRFIEGIAGTAVLSWKMMFSDLSGFRRPHVLLCMGGLGGSCWPVTSGFLGFWSVQRGGCESFLGSSLYSTMISSSHRMCEALTEIPVMQRRDLSCMSWSLCKIWWLLKALKHPCHPPSHLFRLRNKSLPRA